MSIFDRVILTIYTLVIALLSLIIIAFSFKLVSIQKFWTGFVLLYGRWEAGILGFVLLIFSIRFLLSGIKSQKHNETIIRTNEVGSVKISLVAIENLVRKVIEDIEKIKDTNVKIQMENDDVVIVLKLVITSDVVIPELSSELQNTVREYIETHTGITVKEVCISIDNIFNPQKQKGG